MAKVPRRPQKRSMRIKFRRRCHPPSRIPMTRRTPPRRRAGLSEQEMERLNECERAMRAATIAEYCARETAARVSFNELFAPEPSWNQYRTCIKSRSPTCPAVAALSTAYQAVAHSGLESF